VAELHQRSARIQNLEAQLIAAKRTPAELAALVDKVEANVRANVASLGPPWPTRPTLREIFQAMFPDGLTFEPARTPTAPARSGRSRATPISSGRPNRRPVVRPADRSGFV
jgi:hypothetical protein